MRLTKLLNLLYTVPFFPLGWGVDEVLVRLSLIEQIIKDVNLMCIWFRVRHLQMFQESWISLSNMAITTCNMYTYPFSPQLVIKTVKNHDKKPKKSKELSYVDRYFLNRGGISVLGRLFFNWSMSIYTKYKLFIFSSLCILLSICKKF